jgi:hypothetical protein
MPLVSPDKVVGLSGMEVVGFRCNPWRRYRGEGENTYEQGESRRGEGR